MTKKSAKTLLIIIGIFSLVLATLLILVCAFSASAEEVNNPTMAERECASAVGVEEGDQLVVSKENTDLYEKCLAFASDGTLSSDFLRALQQESRVVDVSFIRGATLTINVREQYFGSNRSVFYDGPVSQNDLFLVFPKGFYGDIWWSFGLDNSQSWDDFDDEVDLTLGWARGFRGYNLDVGASYFAIVEILPSDVWNPYLEINKTFQVGSKHSLTPYGKLEYYFPAEGTEPARGLIGRLGVRHSLQLKDTVSLDSWGAAFYDTGAFGFDSGVLYEGGTGISWNLGGSTLSIPEVTCGTPHGRFNDGRETKCVVGLSWTRNF